MKTIEVDSGAYWKLLRYATKHGISMDCAVQVMVFGSYQRTPRDPRCSNCGERGHYARKCTKERTK